MNFHEYKMKIKTHDVKSIKAFHPYDPRAHNYKYFIKFLIYTDSCKSK